MLVAGGGTALVSPLFTGLGAVPAADIRFVLTTSLCMLFGYSGGKVLAEDHRKSAAHQRGAVVREDDAPRPPRARSSVITLAGRQVPALDETKHFKLIGTTGTGKSTAIQEILSTALARGDRAVIADPDGGYMKRFYDPGRGDVVLNPFDERSKRWDLFAEIRTPYDVEQLARSLIPDHEGGDRSWRAYARTFFTAVTRQAREMGMSDVGELYRLLMIARNDELRTLVDGTPAQPFLEEHNSRMFDSIRSVTSSAVGALEYVAQQTGPGLSVRDWVAEERPGVLFMPYKAGQIAALGSTISAWMRLAIFEAMDQDPVGGQGSPGEDRRLWFVIDELDALGQIDGLKDALARLRKFGGRCVIGFQSVAQVSSTYGPGDAHTIVENCGNSLILRCSASEGGGTARFASQLIGEREVVRTSVSRSRRAGELLGTTSRSEQFSVEHAVLPSQIEQLPDLAGYLKRASDREWRRVQLQAVQTWNEYREGRPKSADGFNRAREHDELRLG
jgi:type IV secretory pathway TraG/TraD family ATPase VirD4